MQRQEICSSGINASKKSEWRVTSPQLIITRGKGRTNHYHDSVVHIWLTPIMLLASFPGRSTSHAQRLVWNCFAYAKHVWGQTHTYFTWMWKEESSWERGPGTCGCPLVAAASHPPLKAPAVRRSCKALSSSQAWPLSPNPFFHTQPTAGIIPTARNKQTSGTMQVKHCCTPCASKALPKLSTFPLLLFPLPHTGWVRGLCSSLPLLDRWIIQTNQKKKKRKEKQDLHKQGSHLLQRSRNTLLLLLFFWH